MIGRAWRSGWRRVLAAPAIALSVFVLTVLLALPLASVIRSDIRADLDSSLTAAAVADGVDYDWWQEFRTRATGLGSTFSPSIIGFAATLDNLSSVLDGQAELGPIALALALYLAGWTFLSGGAIDRYARQRPTRAHGFFAACGVFFFRFLRLALVAGAVYWWLFAYLHPWLLDEWYGDLTRDLTAERTAFLWRVGLYAVFGMPLLAANIVFDYARVRLVVEDRRSALGAIGAATRFIGRHPAHTAGLYALNSLVFLLVLAVWAFVAPGVGGTGLPMWTALAVGQAYVIARLLLKLQFMASQTALFQEHLAHARYTAAPQSAWPESPAAETVRQSVAG